MTNDLKTYIIKRVRATLLVLESRFKIVPKFNGRLTRSIGLARTRFNYSGLIETAGIDFATKLVPHLSRKQLDEVIDHEVAHIVACERYGRDAVGHGVFWQLVMSELGYHNPSRTMALPATAPRRKLTRHVALCPTDGVEILVTKYQAEKIGCYRCGSCNGSLILTDETRTF